MIDWKAIEQKTLDEMPGSLRVIAELIGIELALRLAADWPKGRTGRPFLHLPMVVTSHHRLAEIIGIEAARKLCKAANGFCPGQSRNFCPGQSRNIRLPPVERVTHAGKDFYIYTRRATWSARNEHIYLEWAIGKKTRDIAKKSGLTQRAVKGIVNVGLNRKSL